MAPSDLLIDHSTLRKGSKIRASWIKVNPLTCLAGVQAKVGATGVEIVGTIRHIRGDHPTNPTSIRYYVDPDDTFKGARVDLIGCTCGHPHVEIDPAWVSEIL